MCVSPYKKIMSASLFGKRDESENFTTHKLIFLCDSLKKKEVACNMMERNTII